VDQSLSGRPTRTWPVHANRRFIWIDHSERRNYQESSSCHSRPEPEQRRVRSFPSSSAPIKHANTDSTGYLFVMVIRLVSAGSNAESSANPGLFFSFGDDDEEMYTISSTMDANEKLGKATGMEKKQKKIKDICHSILYHVFFYSFFKQVF
jgi:hypothetical protein